MTPPDPFSRKQYSPSLQKDRRENLIRSLEEAISAQPLAISMSYDEAVAIVNALKEPRS